MFDIVLFVLFVFSVIVIWCDAESAIDHDEEL